MIAFAMLYTAAVGLPIALAALGISAVLRRHGKPERLVWLGALATAFGLPIVTLLDPFSGSAVDVSLPQTGIVGLPTVVAVPPESPTLELGVLLVATWSLASGVLALRWAVAGLRLARASRAWQPGALDGVRVWKTEKLGPAVAGTFRPRLLVPRWLESLPSHQRSLVLLHEQEHIRAHDPKLIALARIARILAPWHPIVWLLSARLVRAVELDCDRRVLQKHADVAAYGHTLLTVSERGPGRLVAVAAFAESEAPLRSRILAMTTPSRTISVVALLASMVLGVVLLVGALQIPVPTVSIRIGPEPATSGAPVDDGVQRIGQYEEGLRIRGAQEARRQVLDLPDEQGAAAAGGGPTDTPPSAQEAIDELRRQRQSMTPQSDRRPPVGSPSARSGTEPIEATVAGGPVFTPYTVPPAILNRDEIVSALVREYPPLLRDAGIGGTIRVYFLVGADGTVRDARIDSSSGSRPLDEAALAVASVYRFSPARNGDEAVPVWVSFPITFTVR